MTGSCAACEVPFAKGERFVLQGTEAFHRRCIPQAQRSVLTRTRLELVREKHRADSLHADRARIMRINDDLGDTNRKRLADMEGLSERVDEIAAVMKRQTEAMTRQRETIDRLTSTNTTLRAANDVLRGERDALRAQLIQQATAALPQPSDPPATTAKDTRDDTEVRFSLLELDVT